MTHTIKVIHTIGCDATGCPVKIGPVDDLTKLVDSARAIGWSVEYFTAMARTDVGSVMCRAHNTLGQPGQTYTNADLR